MAEGSRRYARRVKATLCGIYGSPDDDDDDDEEDEEEDARARRCEAKWGNGVLELTGW